MPQVENAENNDKIRSTYRSASPKVMAKSITVNTKKANTLGENKLPDTFGQQTVTHK
jgi:hypothetical protein